GQDLGTVRFCRWVQRIEELVCDHAPGDRRRAHCRNDRELPERADLETFHAHPRRALRTREIRIYLARTKKQSDMNNFQLTPQQLSAYERDGYLIIRNFLSRPEIEKLYGIATGDAVLSKHAFDLNDQTGKKTKLTLWYNPGDDAYGLLTRSRRIVEATDRLLDGDAPVCHFHSKLMQKEPRVG